MDDSSGDLLSNDPIDVSGLPRLADDAYVAVDPRHQLGSVAGWVIAAVVFAIGGAVIASQSGEDIWYLLGAAAAVLAITFAVFTRLAALRVSYQVREHDVSLRRGLISRSDATVPFRRVQHVYLSRGVLERSLGLATLSINSAGPDISVPGLPADTATTLREFIVERAGLDVETSSTPQPTTTQLTTPEPPPPPGPADTPASQWDPPRT